MRVDREGLLKVLESVSPGLAARETINQSSCLVFSGGNVMTFNEEILCTRKSPVALEGAVKAKPLLELLSKLPDEAIEIEQNDKELVVRTKTRKSGIRMEAEVLLPVESVETPKGWRDLDKDFSEAVSIVHTCASHDEATFVLTCVHISPTYMESCDRTQICRYPINTGVEQDILVRADSLRRITGYDMTEVSETESWIHFRNPSGLVLSVRRFLDDYTNMDPFLSDDGSMPVTLPGALEEVVARAEIFSGENVSGNHVTVDLKDDFITIEGEGASGWFKERKLVMYKGSPIRFIISPKLLLSVTKKSNECSIGDGKLFVKTGKFVLVMCTMAPSASGKVENG